MQFSRRDFVKMAGASAALAGLASTIQAQPALANAQSVSVTAMPPIMEADLRRRLAGPEPIDPLSAHTVQSAPNMEPAIPHEVQAGLAKKRLAELEQKTGKRPNILIFLMDNVGWGDLGIYGGGPLAGAPTPNMDRIGHGGLQLMSAYSQPSCTPTRCTLLTGRLPMRHGQLRPSFAGEPGGLGDEITVATLMSDAGYVTQAVGKWHCGEDTTSQPQNVGFDDFYGFLGWSGLYTDWQDVNFAPEFALSPERQELVKEVGFNDHIVHGVKGQEIENLEEITIEMSAQLDDKFATYSEDFLRKMADSDQPFFLYHCTRGAHFKNYPNPKFEGKSPAKYPYKDVIIELDDVIGRLYKVLEETGQLENTLIFITSDNGPAIEPWPDAGYTPFRGGIGTTWEGGQRTPALVHWKGMIPPNQLTDGLFDLADLFNTSLALAQASDAMPTDRYIDGIDQTSFLLGDAYLSNRKYVYYWLQNIFSALRVAEYKWVLAGMSEDHPQVINPGGATALENYKNTMLFNLYLDPRERFSFYSRQTFMDNLFSDPYDAHLATFQTYPPKHPIGTP